MNPSRVLRAAAFASVTACSTGPGAPPTIDVGDDRPTDTQEAAPVSLDNPGSQGRSDACAPCDTTIDCNDGKSHSSVTLKTSNNTCLSNVGFALDCGGKVVQNGMTLGTWQFKSGTYQIAVDVKGVRQTASCTKSSKSAGSTDSTSK